MAATMVDEDGKEKKQKQPKRKNVQQDNESLVSVGSEIDMSKEVESLNRLLSRICFLGSMEENLERSADLLLITSAACDIANEIKYLKSDVVLERKYSSFHDPEYWSNQDTGQNLIFLDDMFDEE